MRIHPFRKYLTKEDLFQESCVTYMRLRHRDKLVIHVPNEGKRSACEAYKFRVLGSSAGVSDLLVMEKNSTSKGLAIELKYGRNKCTESQVEFLEQMSRRGFTAVVVYDNVDEFISVVENYISDNLEHNPDGCIILAKEGRKEYLTFQEARKKLVPQSRQKKLFG